MNEEFIKELDILAQKIYKNILADLKSSKSFIYKFSYWVDMNLETKTKFGLNDDIDFIVNVDSTGGKTEYLYKKMIIEPDCFYLRSNDYHEVSTLTSLQEAIKQDKHNPDIKYLESGEKITD